MKDNVPLETERVAADEGWHVDWILDKGYLPQSIIRHGIRRQLADRIRLIRSTSLEAAYKTKMEFVKTLRTRPIAIETATANTQHYEVGTGVLRACLGPRMKYSCCLYSTGAETLGQAEMEMLDSYVDKADLANGQRILDLGYVRSAADTELLFSLTAAPMKLRLGFQRFVLRRDLPTCSSNCLLQLAYPKGVY